MEPLFCQKKMKKNTSQNRNRFTERIILVLQIQLFTLDIIGKLEWNAVLMEFTGRLNHYMLSFCLLGIKPIKVKSFGRIKYSYDSSRFCFLLFFSFFCFCSFLKFHHNENQSFSYMTSTKRSMKKKTCNMIEEQ